MSDNTMRLPDFGGRYKFILIKRKYNFLMLAQSSEFHKDIWKEYQILGDGEDGDRCTGGGRLVFSDIAKKIRVYGHSQDYGKADQEIVEGIVRDYCETNDLEYEVEMGVGY